MADLPAPAPKPDLSQIPNGALNGAAAQLAAQSGPRFVLPHMQQFQAVWKTPAGTYRFSFDEALKRSHTDALAMRRDGHLIHLLQARYLPVLGADWHIKADDEQDEERAKTYQALLEKTPRFLQLRKCLLEAVWFGRYGVQLAFGPVEVNGQTMQGITAWRPVNGDKINFREDGTPTVRINPAFAARLRDDGATIEDAEKHPHTAWNDQGTVLVLDQPRYRQRFAIHVHEVEDADFSEPELAGGVGGVGLRHYCYWVWWLRQEVMEWLLNYLEMMGAGGLTIVGYDAGNPKGLDLAQQAFEERATVVYLPIPPGQEKQTNLVQRIEPSGTGNDIFHGWIDGYFNAILTRLIIGQDLSSQSSGTGLGSGVADLQADVKQCIHRYDARNLNETETQQLLNVLIALNEPSGNTNLRCETVLKEKEPEKALQAAKQAFDMGAELPESFVVKTAGIPEPKKGERLLSQAQQQQQKALTSAVAGGHASAAGIGLGEMRNYLDAQGIPEEEQLHHLADMVDGGELQEIDTDDGVKYVEAGQYQDTPPSQDQPKTYAKEDWIEETGPRGGKRWTNRKSGTVQYKEPGEGRTGPKDAQIEEPAQEGDKPVAKLRKGMVAQGAYQYADKALRGESNKTLEGEGVLAHVVNLDKRLVKSQVVSLAAQHGMPVSASTTKTRALAFIEDKLRGHLDAHLKQQKGGKAGKERVDSEEAGGAASPAVGANQAQGTMPAASPALPGQATPAPTAEGEYPASAPPGSEERIRLMAERAAQKKPLFGQEEKPNVVQTNAGGFPEAAPARDGTPEVLGQGGSGGGEHPGERAVLEDGAGGGTEAGQEQGQEEGHLPPRQDETLNQYCKRAGIQEAYPHVKAHALQLHQLQREQVDKHNDIVRTAMKALKKESGLVTSRLVAQRGKDGNVDTAKGERAKDDLTKWNKLWSKAKDGGDYASLPGFDQITREIASEHTDLFKGAYRTEGGDDSTGTALDDQEKLFGMLVEGVRPVPDFREAEDQALQDYEESRANHRRATGESADNAESGDTSFEPEFMGEDEAREHLAEHLTPEEMPGTMEAAQENQDAILQGDAPDSGAAEHDRADEGGAQPRQGEEDRAASGEGEPREGEGERQVAKDRWAEVPEEGKNYFEESTLKPARDLVKLLDETKRRAGARYSWEIATRHRGDMFPTSQKWEQAAERAGIKNPAELVANHPEYNDLKLRFKEHEADESAPINPLDVSSDKYAQERAKAIGGTPEYWKGRHREHVEQGVAANKAISRQALQDYPDLHKHADAASQKYFRELARARQLPSDREPQKPADDSFMQPEPPGPHSPDSITGNTRYTNDAGQIFDIRQEPTGTWAVNSQSGMSRAAIANYLNSHGAMRAPGLFRDDVSGQAPVERPKEKLEWAAQTKPHEGPELPGMGDAFAPGMFGQAANQQQVPADGEEGSAQTDEPVVPGPVDEEAVQKLTDIVGGEQIQDFGEKIGGARKDTAVPLGPRRTSTAPKDERPAWQRQYHAFKNVKTGKWSLGDEKTGKLHSRQEFDTEEEALKAVPLIHVARTHDVRRISGGNSGKAADTWLHDAVAKVGALKKEHEGLLLNKGITDRFKSALASGKMTQEQFDKAKAQGGILSDEDYAKALDVEKQIETARNQPMKEDGAEYAIVRKIGERKRPVVKGGFSSEEEATRYMAARPEEIINHEFPFPEEVPHLEHIERTGTPRRQGNIGPKDFQRAFGFRGGEFGNWNTGHEGQAALNHAYDALHDLADTLGVDPKALSLNGKLAIAFGARGHGGKDAARAHYEPGKQVINLTKIKGAGSLAHEWLHALDHYLGGKAGLNGEEAKEAFLSHGHPHNTPMRKELLDSFKGVMDAIHHKNQTVAVKSSPSHIERASGDLKRHLDELDSRLEVEARYNKRYKPFTPEQRKEWDALKEKIVSGDYGEKQYVTGKSKSQFNARQTYEPIERMNELYKQATGRTFANMSDHSVARQIFWAIQGLEHAKDLQKKASEGATEQRRAATDFYSQARKIDEHRLSNYWSTPHELAARAFAGYIQDKLGQDRSDYLVYGAKNHPRNSLLGKPFPEGEERTAINAAFDKLFRTIDPKELHSGETGTIEPSREDAYDRLHQKLGMPDTAFPSLRSMASATSTKQLPTYATPDAAREHVSHAYSTAPAHSPDDAKAHWERMAGLERLGKNDLADVAKAANVHIPPGTTREIAANLIRNAYARRRGASLRAEMTAPGAKGAIGQLPLLPERAEAAVKPAGNLDPVKMDVMSKPELLGHAEKMELYGLGKKSRQEIAAAIRAKLGE